MKDQLKLLSPALVVVALLVIAGCLLAYERETLWKAQEMNLFLDTPLFLKQQMVTSGWLLTWLGCYFTEFFYVPWLGVTLLTLWWAALVVVMWRAFRIPVRWMAVLLIPLAAIVIMNVDIGYWIYYLKLRGHFFAATIGTTIAVGAVWLYRILTAHLSLITHHSSFITPLYIIIITGVLYPLIGFYGLLAALLMGVLVWRIPLTYHLSLITHHFSPLTSHFSPLTSRIIASVVAVLSIVFWPLFYYNYVFCQTNLQNIWWTGLPLFIVDRELPNYYIPYYVLVASLVLLALMFRGEKLEVRGERLEVRGEKLEVRGERKNSLITHHLSLITHHLSLITFLSIHLVLVAAAGYSIHRFWYKDHNFHKELRMQQCMENLDWEGVLAQEVGDEEEPTRAIIMMRNLALFRLGRQGDEMYHYLDGSKPCDSPVPIRMMQVAGYSMYYNYGLANFCHRWCLEQGVEFGFRAEYLKYLTRCALVNGDWQEARKYVALLKHTRYHKAWAERYERFIGHPEQLRAEADCVPQSDLQVGDCVPHSDLQVGEFKPILQLMTSSDVLGHDMMLAEDYIMKRFVRSNSDDKLYKEQSLIAAMWTKDIPMFWTRFSDYVRSHPGERIPIHYQEAAYLYGHLKDDVDISQMPFDEQVKKEYAEFMDMVENMTFENEEEARPVFYTRFGHTFYYNYFFIHDLPLY